MMILGRAVFLAGSACECFFRGTSLLKMLLSQLKKRVLRPVVSACPPRTTVTPAAVTVTSRGYGVGQSVLSLCPQRKHGPTILRPSTTYVCVFHVSRPLNPHRLFEVKAFASRVGFERDAQAAYPCVRDEQTEHMVD